LHVVECGAPAPPQCAQNATIHDLLKALAAVSSMTLLSRILDFGRDTIIAAYLVPDS